MRKTLLAGLCILLTSFGGILAQTKCIWLERLENSKQVQKVGISVELVRLLAHPGANFDINGTKISYDTLLDVYTNGSTIRIEDTTSKTQIYAGKFGENMKEETENHNHLIIESTDSGGTPKINKIRVESVEAVTVLLAMIGSSNSDETIDKIESALERGGLLYIRDLKKDSRLWIYVN